MAVIMNKCYFRLFFKAKIGIC